MMDVTRGDVQKLFNTRAGYSRPIAELVKTIMNVSFRYAVTMLKESFNPRAVSKLMGYEKEQKFDFPSIQIS